MAASISSIVGFNNMNSTPPRINLPTINISPATLQSLIQKTYRDLDEITKFEDQKIRKVYVDFNSTMRTQITNAQTTNFSPEAKLERFKLLFLLSRVHALRFQEKITIGPLASLIAHLQSLIISQSTNQKIIGEIKDFFAKNGCELGKVLLMQNMTEEHSVSAIPINHLLRNLKNNASNKDPGFVFLTDGKADFLLLKQYRITIEHQVRHLENESEAILDMRIYPTTSIRNPDDYLSEYQINLGKDLSVHQFIYQYSLTKKTLQINAIVEKTFTSEILLDFGIEPELEHFLACHKTNNQPGDLIGIGRAEIAHFNLFMKRRPYLIDIRGKTLFHHLLNINPKSWDGPPTLLLKHFLKWLPNPFIKDLDNRTPKKSFEIILEKQRKKHPLSSISKEPNPILSLLTDYQSIYMQKCKSKVNDSLPDNIPTVLISIIQDYLGQEV